jgi:hypothetical protein
MSTPYLTPEEIDAAFRRLGLGSPEERESFLSLGESGPRTFGGSWNYAYRGPEPYEHLDTHNSELESDFGGSE